MASIKYEIVATTEYVDRNGNPKKSYKNVGAVWQSDKGGLFITMDRTFNPAGIPSDRDSIILGCFEPKPRDEKPAQNAAEEDDTIPF